MFFLRILNVFRLWLLHGSENAILVVSISGREYTMKKVLKAVTRILPAYGIFPLVFSFVFNCFVYSGSRMIAGGWYHHNIETGVDRSLPFVPQFLIIYFGCYLFWAVNYILIARQDRRSVYRFFTGDFISRCICLIFFLVYPTTNTRPVITDGGLWNQAALWLYSIDAADNLFPSIHCLVSWFCYLGIRGRKEIPGWYQRVSMVIAILVFASTLLTKQHVIADVAGGVLLAELCFYLGKKTNLYKIYERFGSRIEKRILDITADR